MFLENRLVCWMSHDINGRRAFNIYLRVEIILKTIRCQMIPNWLKIYDWKKVCNN